MARRRRFRPLALLWYAVLGTLGGWLFSLGAVALWANWDRSRAGDAIVVMGAAQYAGRPSPVLRARLDHAVALWKRGLAPRVILTGGVGEGDTTSEAAVGRRYVMRRGVPDTAILLESAGRTTSESLRGVVTLMESGRVRPTAGNGREVILVSDPFHMLRLAILARDLGLVPYTSPTPTSPISVKRSTRWRYYVAESVKIPFVLLVE